MRLEARRLLGAGGNGMKKGRARSKGLTSGKRETEGGRMSTPILHAFGQFWGPWQVAVGCQREGDPGANVSLVLFREATLSLGRPG